MDLGLAGRVAIVTGANTGIGRACAAEFLAEGAHVVVVNRDRERNAKVCAELSAHAKGRVLGILADLEQDAAVRAMVERTLAEFGRIDILVNNAAVVGAGDFTKLTDEQFGRMFEHKLNGTARCMRHVIPPMRERKWGRIVNITGGAARQPQPAAISVGLNNAAILNLTKAIANDLAKDGILVNSVVPGTVHTERLDETIRKAAQSTGKTEAELWQQRVGRIPLGRMGRPEEVAAVVAFMASERASFIAGTAWPIDGGASATI